MRGVNNDRSFELLASPSLPLVFGTRTRLIVSSRIVALLLESHPQALNITRASRQMDKGALLRNAAVFERNDVVRRREMSDTMCAQNHRRAPSSQETIRSKDLPKDLLLSISVQPAKHVV